MQIIQPKRSKFKKSTINYVQDNILDIIDIEETLSKDQSKLFNKKVILSLFVKVEKDWLNSQKQLFNLGYFVGDKDE